MKFDFKALVGGLVLVAAVPLLMLWQSSDHSKGTSPGHSKYNTQLLLSEVCIHLRGRNTEALKLFCDFTLDIDGNIAYTEAWANYMREHCGECTDVHLACGRIAMYRGDRDTAQRDYKAALDAAGSIDERSRAAKVIMEHKQ